MNLRASLQSMRSFLDFNIPLYQIPARPKLATVAFTIFTAHKIANYIADNETEYLLIFASVLASQDRRAVSWEKIGIIGKGVALPVGSGFIKAILSSNLREIENISLAFEEVGKMDMLKIGTITSVAGFSIGWVAAFIAVDSSMKLGRIVEEISSVSIIF